MNHTHYNIKILQPYWANERVVTFNIWKYHAATVAETIAWFYFGDKYRAEPL